jgi:hypothetical protein
MKKRKSSCARLLPVAALLLLACLPVSAKHKPDAYALIFATVYDVENHPVYGVPVKIRRAGQDKAKWELVTDHRGEAAQRLPVGKADYIVWIDMKDSKAAARTEVKVHIENDERQDVSLHLIEEASKKKK